MSKILLTNQDTFHEFRIQAFGNVMCFDERSGLIKLNSNSV